MLHVSQLVEGRIYRLQNEMVRIVSMYKEPLSENHIVAAVVLYEKRNGIRSVVRERGYTDFEELTPLEKELHEA